MPTAEEVLGFSNRWYPLGIETAIERTLAPGVSIRGVAPPLVIATKLAAWRGRGHGDILRSLDVHDIVVLSNGRPELADEPATQGVELRTYVAQELAALLAEPYFDYVVQSVVAGYGDVAQARATIVRDRLAAIIERVGTH
jgi:hypothetical protein